jgi:hypothetical protein
MLSHRKRTIGSSSRGSVHTAGDGSPSASIGRSFGAQPVLELFQIINAFF